VIVAGAVGPRSLLEALQVAGDVPATWNAELARVRRADFISDRMWIEEASGYLPVDRGAEPDQWEQAAYANRVVVTQFDDGETAWPAVGRRPTCSASMPSAVVGMLDALDVRRGHRVLEIGTGTGYNAALLSERLGAGAVTTIEIDIELAQRARRILDTADYGATVVCGDGTAGWPQNAPYDRIIATAAVQLGHFPHAWIMQTVPGGVILVPMRTDLSSGPLVRFVVGPDGMAQGAPVAMRVGFMELRSHRNPLMDWDGLRWDDPAADLSETKIEPWSALLRESSRWAIGIAVPSCRYFVEKATSVRPHGVAWLADPLSRSWASVVPGAEKGRYDVRQTGPRRLWDEVATAYRWWIGSGSPTIDRWRFTIGPATQTVTLG
jgi:protein-L-isoaspartate(D-aspartate) O-methyltransferase